MIHGLRHNYGAGEALGNDHEHGVMGGGHGINDAQIRAIFAKGGQSAQQPKGPLRAPKNLPAPPPGSKTGGGGGGSPKPTTPKAPAPAKALPAPKANQLKAGSGAHLGGKIPKATTPKEPTGKLPKVKAPPLKPGQTPPTTPKAPKVTTPKVTTKSGHHDTSVEKVARSQIKSLGHIEHAGSRKGSLLGEAVKLGKEAVATVGGGESVISAVKQEGGHHEFKGRR